MSSARSAFGSHPSGESGFLLLLQLSRRNIPESRSVRRSRRRGYVTSTRSIRVDTSGLDEPSTFASTSDDSWFNLSYEEWLFRNSPITVPILYFYRNRPSVIIGRNQNPWKETNPLLLSRDSIPLLRRRSGGGAVFHDPGNTNFSIMIPRALFSRSLGAEIVSTALREHMGIDGAGVNERGDLVLCSEDDGARRKISGSAYKIVSQRAYHHGTMLISSDLGSLGKYLKGSFPEIETKGVDSVRSPVTTIRTASSTASHESFIRAVAKVFHAVFSRRDALEGDEIGPIVTRVGPELRREEQGYSDKWDKIEAGIKELKSWDWVYGQTPEFSQSFEEMISGHAVEIKLRSKHTVIKDCSIIIDGYPSPKLEGIIPGRSYGRMDPAGSDASEELTGQELEVYKWLAGRLAVS